MRRREVPMVLTLTGLGFIMSGFVTGIVMGYYLYEADLAYAFIGIFQFIFFCIGVISLILGILMGIDDVMSIKNATPMGRKALTKELNKQLFK